MVDFFLYHLDAAGFAGEADNAHIVTGYALNGYHISIGDVDAVGQSEKLFAVVLETHLDAVERRLQRTAYAVHPVAGTHFAAAAQLCLADGHIAVGLMVAAAREVDRFVVFHLRQRRVGLKIGVHSAIAGFIVDGHLRRVAVIVVDVAVSALFGIVFLAAAFDESLHLFGRGDIVVFVVGHIAGSTTRYFAFLLFDNILVGMCVLVVIVSFVVFAHKKMKCIVLWLNYLFFKALLIRNESSIKAILP